MEVTEPFVVTAAEDADEVEEQAVGVKGIFLKEDELGIVAAIDASLAEGTETAVGLVFGAKGGERHPLLGGVAQQPHVSLAALVVHLLEGVGHRAAVPVVGKHVAPTRIGHHLAQGAAPARHVPGRAVARVEDDAGCLVRLSPAFACGEGTVPRLLQGQVGGLHGSKEAVGRLAAAEQAAIEAHPFGAGQG